MKKLYIILIAFALLGTQACKKDGGSDNPEPTPVQSIEDLVINENFNYNNTINHHIQIKLPFTVDYTHFRNKVELFTKSPIDGGKLISSVSTDANGLFDGYFELPTYLDSIYVSTKFKSAYINIKGSKSTLDGIIDFGEDYQIGIPPTDSIENEKSAIVQSINFLESHHQNANITNIIGNGDFSNNDFGTIAWWNTAHPADGKWYLTNHSYYGTASWEQENSNGYVRTPLQSNRYTGGASQMIDAQAGDVITVSADIKRIGNSASNLNSYLYLIPVNSNNQPLNYFSVYYRSPSKDWRNKTLVATMPPNTVKVNVLLWNSDYNNGSAIAWDNIEVSGPVTDQDNDGVADDEDDYPNDASRAFNIYYPNEEDFATIAFEDNWPEKGDYDFNDLVIDYQYKEVVNKDNGIVDLFGTFDLVAMGASFDNGFGFQMGAPSNAISSISGQVINSDYISLNGNGTESGQDKATVIVFDNGYDILQHPGGSIGVNTEQDATYVNVEPVTIQVSFENPVSRNTNGIAPFNPFIIINQDRGREAHLPNMVPTSKINEDYLGSSDDNSIVTEGRYYKTEQNLPWAINIPVAFDYPIEKIEIIDAHLHFADWAVSSGADYTDWYLDNSGYRNNTNIYNKPE
ncbi:MAG: LruC domain-containing protein [Bacteroidales bacterium]|nr:LruC domain-containing protein [Bacteroidales bacterium]